MKRHCGITGKVCFKSAKRARDRQRQINASNISDKTIQSYYKCDHCDYWHLTSMSKSKFQVMEKHKNKIQELILPKKSLKILASQRLEYLRNK